VEEAVCVHLQTLHQCWFQGLRKCIIALDSTACLSAEIPSAELPDVKMFCHLVELRVDTMFMDVLYHITETGCDYRPVYVHAVVDRVALRQASPRILLLSSVSVTPAVTHTRVVNLLRCSTIEGDDSILNLLKPTGHVMHHQFNIQQLYALPTLYLCILYLSENKQRLVPLTA
jgi:hypothetical protein